MPLDFSLRYLSYTTSIMTVKAYGGIVRYVLEKRSDDFEKGKEMNTIYNNLCLHFISQSKEHFCISQKGFIFVCKNKVKQRRDNCMFIDNP